MELVLLIGGAVLGLVLTVLFQGALEGLAVRVFGALAPSPKSPNLKGTWYAYYEVVKDGSPLPSPGASVDSGRIEKLVISQVGSSIVGRNAKHSREYFLRLKLEDGCILTGTWRDQSGGRKHYGGLQLRWDYSGRYMTGKFVGRDRHNQVNFGPWVFTRQEADLQDLIDEWRCRAIGQPKAIEPDRSSPPGPTKP